MFQLTRRLLRAATAGAIVASVFGMAAMQSRGTAPPPKALVRYDPRVYDVQFSATLAAFPASDSAPAMTLAATPFILPMVMRGATSQIDPASMRPEMWLDNRADRTLSSRAKIEENKHLGMVWAILPLERFSGSTLRWQVSWRCQSFSTRVDENLLASIAWPREWPADVQDALKPQLGIESDSPAAGQVVAAALGDRARQMPPWFAAKETIRATILAFRAVNSDGLERRGQGRIVGMSMVGAGQAIVDARGSRHDLVAACIATLRRAGIPARPVVGLAEEMVGSGPSRRERTIISSWGELYLPNAGWIPFDPNDLRGAAIRQLRVDQPWREIGTLDDLNERVVIAYSFAPEGLIGPSWPSIWGAAPNGRLDASSFDATISFSMISRGRGVPDP